jgi:hypothetical protein
MDINQCWCGCVGELLQVPAVPLFQWMDLAPSIIEDRQQK